MTHTEHFAPGPGAWQGSPACHCGNGSFDRAQAQAAGLVADAQGEAAALLAQAVAEAAMIIEHAREAALRIATEAHARSQPRPDSFEALWTKASENGVSDGETFFGEIPPRVEGDVFRR